MYIQAPKISPETARRALQAAVAVAGIATSHAASQTQWGQVGGLACLLLTSLTSVPAFLMMNSLCLVVKGGSGAKRAVFLAIFQEPSLKTALDVITSFGAAYAAFWASGRPAFQVGLIERSR